MHKQRAILPETVFNFKHNEAQYMAAAIISVQTIPTCTSVMHYMFNHIVLTTTHSTIEKLYMPFTKD